MNIMAMTLWPLLLPFAAFSGWIARDKRKLNQQKPKIHNISQQYLRGLNFLLNEQPDAAVDIFIKLLEVDSNTVETHLALGSLFRRRGEVDRAIRIHQNLIARPQLEPEQRYHALLALGRDYMRAGVLDRAERVFQQIVDKGTPEQSATSLRYLLEIYEQEKSWLAAIEAAQRLQRLNPEPIHYIIAHHYCELANQHLQTKQFESAKKFLKQALSQDKNSVRATLLQAQISQQLGQSKAAIKAYMRVAEQNPDYISEIIEPLMQCHQQQNTIHEGIIYLQQLLQRYPRIAIILVLADHVKQTQSQDAATDFITTQLQRAPSLRGLHQLISWDLANANGNNQTTFQVLNDLSQKLLSNKPSYQCSACGFAGKTLHWHCPGCKQWNTIKPLHGLEGDK